MGGFVVLRLRAHWLLVTAALLTVLLTTSVLAALAGLTGSVGDAGLRRTLGSTAADRTTLLVGADLPFQQRARSGALIDRYAAQGFDGLPYTVRSSAVSKAYGLPPTPGAAVGADPDLTVLATLDRTEISLLRGSWPGAPVAGQPVPVALPAAAQARLPALGSVLSIKDRFTGRPLAVRLVGVYQARSIGDLYWQLDQFGGKGVSRVGFTSYGPLLVDDSVFAGGTVTQRTMHWQVRADFTGVSRQRVDTLGGTMADALVAMNHDTTLGDQVYAASGLPLLVPALDRSLLVSRSSLLVGALQLVLLTVFAILLVARLIADAHESEDALLSARGATGRRLGTLACAEAALLVLPALVAGPLLAGPLVGLLQRHGPLADVGVRLGPLPTVSVLGATAATALGCLAVLLTPYLRRRRPTGAGGSARVRRRVPPGLLRAGGDVMLTLLAAVAYWQLQHYAATGTGTLAGGGPLGIDPVLVTAPALTLCAGAVLAMRLLPLVARIGDRFASGSRALPGALAGWQLSRRPQQGAAPTIMLLVLAVAMGTLAVGQSSSILRSEGDQAAFQTGADLRVSGSTGNVFGQGDSYRAIPGVRSAVGVVRVPVALAQNRTGQLIALDSGTEAGLLPLRSDLSGSTAAQLLAPLAAAAAAPAAAPLGLPLPGRPHSLVLDIGATASGGSFTEADTLFVTVTDRTGIPYRLDPVTVPVDGRIRPIRLDLDASAGAPLGVPSYPLTITGLEVDYAVPPGHPVRQTFTVHALHADGQPVPVPRAGWSATRQATDEPDSASFGVLDSVRSTTEVPFSLAFSSMDGRQYDVPQHFGFTLTRTPTLAVPTSMPAVATTRYLQSSGAHIGSTVNFGPNTPVLRITGVVKELPGSTAPGANTEADADGGALLIDLRSYEVYLSATGQPPATPGEWWIGVAPGHAAQVAASLRARPDVQNVLVQQELRDQLKGDPLAAGSRAALLCTAIIAALLAAVGFGVGAAGSVRRRSNEAGVLRALGASRRELARSTAVELGLPLLLGVAVGLLLGALLTRMVIPLIVLTSAATRPDPPVLVELPLGQLSLFLAAAVVIPLAVTLLAGFGGGDSAQRLRTLEEL